MSADTKQSPPPAARNRAAEGIVVVVSLLVSVAAAEVFLRVTDRFRPPKNPPECGYWDPHICDMYQGHPAYGYALRPSTATEYLYPETEPRRRIQVRSNRHGFRGPEFGGTPAAGTEAVAGAAESTPRVLVLGDSFVFGEGVEEDERLTEVLERKVSGAWRVDNLGMTGWGPDLMLRALETVGLDLKPDAVILCLYTHDFRRVHPLYAGIGYPIPRYELRDGALVDIPYPEPSVWQKLRILWALSPVRRSYDSGMWDVHTALLDRFRALGDEHGFRLGLVFLPGRADTDPDRERRQWLGSYAADTDVPFLDLTDPLLERPRKEILIHSGNPHWDVTGHQLVGEALAPFLLQEVRHEIRPD
ncbi:MAG: SGNH/GDSL hydrolase family protein [Gemmatimonadetes bacterium]|nr:SGNH/GDSL hydrolase family protein [Gemmatimonadota bacterium]